MVTLSALSYRNLFIEEMISNLEKGGNMKDTELEEISTTESGTVKKKDAVKWLESLGDPDPEKLLDSVEPKPDGFSGSTFATPISSISSIRATGSPEFIEEFAKLLKVFLSFESYHTRLALNLKKIRDRETEELTDNYALYVSVAERSGRGADVEVSDDFFDSFKKSSE